MKATLSILSDVELCNAVRAGDAGAWEALEARHYNLAAHCVAGVLKGRGGPQLREELSRDALSRVWLAVRTGKYDGARGRFVDYLARAAKNVARHWRERACNRLPHGRCGAGDDDYQPAAAGLTPDEQAASAETCARIESAVASLSGRDAEVVRMRLEGHQGPAIAARFGVSKMSVSHWEKSIRETVLAAAGA